MVELVLFAIVGQSRAVDEELDIGQRFGGGAVVDAFETHHHDIAGRADVVDLESATVLRIKRTIVGKRQRIAGEGLHAQLALDAVRSADYGHLDRIFWFGHRPGFIAW